MKTKILFLFWLVHFLVYLTGYSQEYISGSLYISVVDSTGIPMFIQDSGNVVVEMDNQALETLFNDYGVYAFDKSFPIIDSFPQTYKFGIDSLYTLECTGNDSLLMIEIINLDPTEYSYVERIPMTIFIYVPNDYHLLDPQFNNESDYALDVIRAKEAWDISMGDPNIKIGVVDEGVDTCHEDFGINHEQIEYLMNGDPGPAYPHGTFVCGLVAAKTDNNIGKSAIGFNCKIYFATFPPNWTGGYAALLDLFYQGAKVLNCSWKGAYSVSNNSIVQFINSNGGLIIAAADNHDSENYVYPACYDNVLAVTSTGPGDSLEFYNPIYNQIQIHNHHDRVDVCAPGHLVRSLGPLNTYAESSGTSFASPIVVGSAGLVYSEIPNASPKIVRDILQWSCKYIDDINEEYTNLLGYGRIDAYEAVRAASLMPDIASNYYINNGENVTWDTPKWVDNEIRIYNGGQLTITSPVFFNENAKIVVERGGLLTIDKGYLTSYGDFLWKGIEVWGTFNQNQYIPGAQGEVRLLNRASISYAEVGIITTKRYGIDHTMDEYNGGIIIARNSIFTNNVIAVEFRPYENHNPGSGQIANNRSYFSNCLFEYEKNLDELGGNYSHLVKLSGVRGIKFLGCDFRYASIFYYHIPITEDNGTGIYSRDSDFLVDVHVSEINQQIIKPCTFKKLYYGIHAEGITSTKTVIIDKTEFTNVFRSIYLGGISNPTITLDTILIGLNHFSTNDTAYGIYLDQCTGYKVEENYIRDWLTNEPNTSLKGGIIINNSGADYNEIYKNTVDDINTAIVAQNNNRGYENDPLTGLKLYCNDLINDFYDIVVTANTQTLPIGISKYQGYYYSQFDRYSAGNLFSKLFLGTDGDYNNQAMFIRYFHHDPTNEPRVYPEDYSEETILLSNTGEDWSAQSCPSQLDMIDQNGTGGMYNEMVSAQFLADSVKLLLETEVDGGNTDQMATDVMTSFPYEAWDIYTDLMNESPYLSDTVMKEAVNKENVLAEAMVRDILVANPQSAKSEEVMETLDSRNNPLPDYMIAEIEQGKNNLSAKEIWEAEISHYEHTYAMARNELLRYYIKDTLQPGPNDSLVALLQGENSCSCKYDLAMAYCDRGDIANMNVVLNSFANPGTEHQDYVIYLGLLANLRMNELTVYDLDSIQKQQILDLAVNGHGKVKVYARNIMQWLGEIDYNEPVILPDGSLKSTPFVFDIPQTETPRTLCVYPNPADNYVILSWDMPIRNATAQVNFIDMNGKIIKVVSVTNARGQKVVNINELPSGIYVCCLMIGRNVAESLKLTVK